MKNLKYIVIALSFLLEFGDSVFTCKYEMIIITLLYQLLYDKKNRILIDEYTIKTVRRHPFYFKRILERENSNFEMNPIQHCVVLVSTIIYIAEYHKCGAKYIIFSLLKTEKTNNIK